MMIKNLAVKAALILLLLLPALACKAQTAGKDENAVASVNGITIDRTRLEREMSRQEQQLTMQGLTMEESQREAFRNDVLDRLINQELILQESRRKGYTAAPAALEEQIGAIRGQFPDQESFIQALTQWSFTEESLAEEIARGLTIQAYIEAEISLQVSIGAGDALSYYQEHPEQFARPEQLHARHILISLEEAAAEDAEREARGRIEDIQQKLQAGGDFAALAEEYSEGPSAPRGGDLGYFGRGQMVPPFEEAVFALSVGEVSGIVRTAFGFHLIELVDRQPPGLIAFEEIQADLIDYLTQERVSSSVDTLVDALRAGADIETFPEEG
jgi:peptidyl-prolyl cis-trans isomerase C